MKKYHNKSRSRRGMAMLVVLFIVMAIAVISSGFIARSDAALQCGRNYLLRNEADYLAWAGLEVAEALVQDPNSVRTYTKQPVEWEDMPNFYYDLDIDKSDTDPNRYQVSCAAYKEVDDQRRASSMLDATLFYDPNSTQAYYISVTRQ